MTYGKKNAQVVNGETTLSAINGKLGSIDADKTWEITVTANNKNNADVKKNYTLTIDLEDPKDGKTLADLDFSATAQETDKLIALKSVKDVNTFDAQIDTHTNGSTNVTNLNLEVPVSLTDKNDLGLVYHNMVTNFATKDGGVAYIVVPTEYEGTKVKRLEAINPADSSTLDSDDYAVSSLTDNTQIVVLNEKYARYIENEEQKEQNPNWIYNIEADELKDNGTVYQVNINVKPADGAGLQL